MFGLLNSATAISAALRIDWPASPALPGADNGRIRPALTCPVPMVAPGGACALCGAGVVDKYWEFPEQPVKQRARRGKQARNRAAPRWHSRRPLNLHLRGHGGSPHDAPSVDATPFGHIGGEWLTK